MYKKTKEVFAKDEPGLFWLVEETEKKPKPIFPADVDNISREEVIAGLNHIAPIWPEL